MKKLWKNYRLFYIALKKEYKKFNNGLEPGSKIISIKSRRML